MSSGTYTYDPAVGPAPMPVQQQEVVEPAAEPENETFPIY